MYKLTEQHAPIFWLHRNSRQNFPPRQIRQVSGSAVACTCKESQIMYACIYTCTYLCMSMYAHAHWALRSHVDLCMYMYMHTCICVFTFDQHEKHLYHGPARRSTYKKTPWCMNSPVYIYIYIYIYIYGYAHVYKCISAYIYHRCIPITYKRRSQHAYNRCMKPFRKKGGRRPYFVSKTHTWVLQCNIDKYAAVLWLINNSRFMIKQQQSFCD